MAGAKHRLITGEIRQVTVATARNPGDKNTTKLKVNGNLIGAL